MSVPKSVTKVKKDGVTYESFADQNQYYIFELSRAALRDVGKYVRTKFREIYYQHFNRHTGNGPKAVKYTVYSNKNTKFPRVDIGLPQSKPGSKVQGFYSFFQEFGTSKTPKLGLLQKVVSENVAEIVEIESKYLSALSGEADRLQKMIDEREKDSEDEE